ncbi:MAG: zinc-dependent peptidase [Verrucomicrobiales bacterium]
MNNAYIILIIIVVLMTVVVLYAINRSSVTHDFRMRLMDSEFPEHWKEVLKKDFPLYNKLPNEIRDKLHSYINVFMEEKSFEACGSLDELTEEMCITIAAQACLLLVNGRCGFYDKLTTILVYPDMYSAGSQQNKDGTIGKSGSRLGESWEKGTVILSWKHSLRGPAIANDGQNLVIHEFAHQLDQWDGAADGAPLKGFVNEHKDWSKNFQEAYDKHGKLLKAGRKLVIDAYGATNPAEFFAVSTETFFEKPRKLSTRYPDIYEELKNFYQLDPLSW